MQPADVGGSGPDAIEVQMEVAGDQCDASTGKPEVGHGAEKGQFSFLQAVGFNTLNMFGTGPFITIPYCLAAVSPQGPHAMIGYGIACVACMCDSLVWAELGSMWPVSGGPYVYLRELYGRETVGRLASFMYVWQFFVSCPCEVASGFIAIAEYLVYFSPAMAQYSYRVAISLFCLAISGLILFRGIGSIGRVALGLWAVTIGAIIFTLAAGFSDWHPEYLQAPKDAFSGGWGQTLGAIAAATSFGVYDMAGYYDVCYMGGAIKDGRRNIPRSCIITCCVVACLFILTYLAVLGHLDWREFVGDYDGNNSVSPPGIMSRFAEHRMGPAAAYIMTVVVAITIFGATFSVLCGQTYVPYAAAKDKIFFQIFGREGSGIPSFSLLSILCLAGVWCFFSMDVVIKGLVSIVVFVQFMGQSVGLMYYRWRTPVEEQPAGFRMPLYPLPCIVQLIIFFSIWITTDSWLLWGSDQPILELSVCYILLGPVAFLLHAKVNKAWPFEASCEARQPAADPLQEDPADTMEQGTVMQEDNFPISLSMKLPSAIVQEDSTATSLGSTADDDSDNSIWGRSSTSETLEPPDMECTVCCTVRPHIEKQVLSL